MPAPTDLDPASVNSGSAGRRDLVVSEVFGPTIQGEGPSIGRRCSFLRLGGCNLHCSWCDTPYTWDWTGRNGVVYDPARELTRRSVADVWRDLRGRGADMLVISGGEPMLQQDALVPLITLAREAAWWVEVETAGTIAPSVEMLRLVDRFNVSPKLENSGNAPVRRYMAEAIEVLARSGKAAWKFVVCVPGDLDEIAALVDAHGLKPVYVMPEGIDAAVLGELGRQLADEVVARGWNLTTRLHILIYGNRRGV